MRSLSANDIKCLEALATFHYLSPAQMERLGIGTKRAYIRQHTLPRLLMGRYPLIKSQSFGAIPGKGRLENLYFLTKYGAREVADLRQCDPQEIRFPKYGIKFQNDYFHRKMFVDFHIWLRHWIDDQPDAELEFFNPYYFKDGKGRSINQFRFKPSDYRSPYDRLTIEPDGVFRYLKDGKPYLCVVEVHRKPDVKAIVKQLDQHMEALTPEQNLIAESFDHKGVVHIYSVHENETTMKAVEQRLRVSGQKGLDQEVETKEGDRNLYKLGFYVNSRIEKLRNKPVAIRLNDVLEIIELPDE